MRRFMLALAGAVAVAGLALAPTASSSQAPPPTAWLWLSAHETAPCTFTADVTWSGYGNLADTLEVFVTQGYTGAPLVPSFSAIKKKDGTATVTLAPLASSPTADYFYVWAQLLDNKGVAIPGSLDFTGQTLAYCTG